MRLLNKSNLWMVSAVFCMALTSCSESNELEVVDSVQYHR